MGKALWATARERPGGAAEADAAGDTAAVAAAAAMLAVRLMAGCQEMQDEWRRKEAAKEAASGKDGAAGAPPLPPPPPPLLLASDGQLHPANKLTWPDQKASKALAALPSALQRALHGASAGARAGGSLTLHPAVHSLLLDAADGSVPGGGGESAMAIRKALTVTEALRREAASDNRALPLRAIFARFFAAQAAAGSRGADAEAVVALTRHLKEQKQPQLCSHAQIAGGAVLPVGQCAVGAAFGNGSLEDLQRRVEGGAAASFVDGVYVDKSASSHERASWRSFFVAAGASDGLAFLVSASPVAPSLLPAGASQRSSAKSVALPYGLGCLGHKRPVVLDAALTPASARLLRAALARGDEDASLAVAFCDLVARAAVDDEEAPSAAEGPLAPCLRGEGAPAALEQPTGGGAALTATVGTGLRGTC